MKKLVNSTFFCILLFVTMVFSAAVSAQGPGQSPLPAQATTDVQPPNPKGSDPKPEDATKAILAAFDKYDIVGMGAAHRNKNLDDFILDLIRNPALPSKINDVAVECGNSLYQPILDRYIAGNDVPLAEVRHDDNEAPFRAIELWFLERSQPWRPSRFSGESLSFSGMEETAT
jgi:hypothetical protein